LSLGKAAVTDWASTDAARPATHGEEEKARKKERNTEKNGIDAAPHHGIKEVP